MIDLAPPCIIPGEKPNRCAIAHYSQHVMHSLPLPGPWTGWRIQGRWLIGPRGRKISREHLERVLQGAEEGPESGPAQVRECRRGG